MRRRVNEKKEKIGALVGSETFDDLVHAADDLRRRLVAANVLDEELVEVDLARGKVAELSDGVDGLVEGEAHDVEGGAAVVLHGHPIDREDLVGVHCALTTRGRLALSERGYKPLIYEIKTMREEEPSKPEEELEEVDGVRRLGQRRDLLPEIVERLLLPRAHRPENSFIGGVLKIFILKKPS